MVPIHVFISYSHRDEAFKDDLVVHLANLKRQGKITAWQDRDIEAGAEWDEAIKQALEGAQVILMLITPRFMASDYCYDQEMQRALERHEAGTARVIPIIIKPVDWQGSPFSKLQVLPKDAKPVTQWGDQDEAFLNVVQGIRRAVESLQTAQEKTLSPSPPLPVANLNDRPQIVQGTPIAPLESPEGQVRADSPFYVARPQDEQRCHEELRKPGGLLRLKSPKHMGKSSLMVRLLATAQGNWNYRTVAIDLNQTNQRFFEDPEKFLQWFCASVGKVLNIRVKLEEYWDDIFGANDNATDYFEKYLLIPDDRPLVLAIDNFDRIFAYDALETDFCGLLRGWYERSKIHPLWEKLRIIIVHSQESYAERDINQSPFNVGLPIELGEFTQQQVDQLQRDHGLNLSLSELDDLQALIGGHPYMIRSALYYLASGDFTLTEFLETAPTERGIFRNHLRGQLQTLQHQPELAQAMKAVVKDDRPVRLKSKETFQLDSLGLIRLVAHSCVEPRCQLYRIYFHDRLQDL